MKSPLNDDALTTEDLSELVGQEIARIEFDTNGKIADSIKFALVEAGKIIDVDLPSGQVNLMSRFGWIDSWNLVGCGLAPNEDGSWSTQYCVVAISVAERLLEEWNEAAKAALPIDRGSSRNATSAYGEFRQV